MAHLWICEAGEHPRAAEWVATSLAGDWLAVSPALGVRRAAGARDVWVAVGSPAAHVNGVALDAGIRVLRDRDELRAGDSRAFFSTESLTRVAVFPGAAQAVFCPRCKLEIEPQCPAVRCPQCGVWHHETEELPCWVYTDRCVMCDQPSALDGGFRWSPEGL